MFICFVQRCLNDLLFHVSLFVHYVICFCVFSFLFPFFPLFPSFLIYFPFFPSVPAARRGRPRDTDTDVVTMHMQVHVELAAVSVFEAEILVLWLRYGDCSW